MDEFDKEVAAIHRKVLRGKLVMFLLGVIALVLAIPAIGYFYEMISRYGI